MKKILLFILLAFTLVGCVKEVVKAPTDLKNGEIMATMNTTKGTILIKLHHKEVPHTVNNFIGLSQQKFYDGIIFHRVIKNFMSQSGDPTGTGRGGKSIYGDKFNDEFNENLSNIKYSLSMANAGANTNGSQFFINQSDNTNLDFNKPDLRSQHSVFGQVIVGMDIVDSINEVDTMEGDKPKIDIKIINIKIQQNKKGKLIDYIFDTNKAIKNYKTFLSEQQKITQQKQTQQEAQLKKEFEARKENISKTGSLIAVIYTLILEDGTIKDSNKGKAPFQFKIGAKQVIPAWDKELLNRKRGDTFKLEVEPKDGYGGKTVEIQKNQVAPYVGTGVILERGNTFPAPDGTKVNIIESTEETITIKNTHHLAGEKLFFDIEIIDVDNK